MANVECNVKNCGYNDSNFCQKKSIDIEGLFAKSRIGTFCQSFRNPLNSKVLMNEFAKEMNLEKATDINCSANYCIYNKDNHCIAKDIKIGNEQAQFRSETQCNSFKLK